MNPKQKGCDSLTGVATAEQLRQVYENCRPVVKGIDAIYETISGFQSEIESCFKRIDMYAKILNLSPSILYIISGAETEDKFHRFYKMSEVNNFKVSDSDVVKECYNSCNPIHENIERLRNLVSDLNQELDAEYSKVSHYAGIINLSTIELKVGCCVCTTYENFTRWYSMKR